jgi:hypothetical protein
MPATALHTTGTYQGPIHVEQEYRAPAEPGYRIIRRSGTVTPFDATKITVALTKAFLAVEGPAAAGSRRVHEVVEDLTGQVVSNLTRRVGDGRTFHIEDVQDQVELALMRGEHHKVARAYVLYREDRARERAVSKAAETIPTAPLLNVKAENGDLVPLDEARFAAIVIEACAGLSDAAAEPILAEARRNFYDGITLSTCRGWAPHSRPSATCSSTTSACRRSMTATSCTCARRASSCHRPSSCAWPWAWRSTRSTAKRAPSSSTKCCPLRFHVQHADAVQQRHAALAAVELLPDDGADDLDGIYEAIKENALLSKFAGGLGNDWTPVRALGSHIKGTNGESRAWCRS